MPVTSQTLDPSIRFEVLDGTWETCGVERDVEVDPETLVCSANEWGPDKASFVLRRNPWGTWPDLQPFTPVEIEIGGVVVWEGRTNGTPLKGGAEQQISVQCEGWQYQLDDDLFKRFYVHATLSDWKDARSYPDVPLAYFQAGPSVRAETGVITLTLPKGITVTAGKTLVGVILDLGEAGAKQVAITLGESTFLGGTSHKLVCCAEEGAAGSGEQGFTAFQLEGASNTVHLATFAEPQRYVTIFVIQEEGSGVVAEEEFVKILGVSVFSETAYQSADESVLKATTVAIDALTHAPLISTDHSQIDVAADEFDIPSLVMAQQKTPRQMIEAVNAFHNWITKIDLSRRLVFAPRPLDPLLEWGAWSGEEIEDTSAGEGSEIYTRAIGEGTAANDEQLDVPVESLVSPTAQEALEENLNIVRQRGFRRSKSVPVSNTVTAAVLEKLAEVYLAGQQSTPFAGSLIATVGSVRQVLGGQPVHPSLLLRNAQELLRISNAIDPTTGAVGRDGKMVAISYEHATQSAQVSLDNRLDSFEALLDRFAALEEVGS